MPGSREKAQGFRGGRALGVGAGDLSDGRSGCQLEFRQEEEDTWRGMAAFSD